ncbi:4-hydroxybenzoate octaprenyltransferase [Planctomycetales bacterium]|nr:4-hydroxybenzoate octaprenyltransferase [Planctomycetales bacterium]
MSIITNYLGLIRFSHTLFAMPFALLAYAMALHGNLSDGKAFRWLDIAGILLCMVFARSTAMTCNRIADRKIDAENPRTARRHLPAGGVSITGAIAFLIFCGVGFIAATLLFLPDNHIPLLASVPVLLFLCGYSYTKYWTSAAHFWLGASLMLAPLAAWIAVRPQLEAAPVLLGFAVLFWCTGFDLIYATQDAEFDNKRKLFSIPGRYGISAALRLSALCHVVAVILLAALPFVFKPFGLLFGIGVAASATILIAEHLVAAPKRDSPDIDRINVAFFHLNVCISVGLLAVGVIDIIW